MISKEIDELYSIESLRKKLIQKLKEYDYDEAINLEIDKKVMREILLNEEDNSFAIPFDLVKKLDLSNFSFNGVNVRFLNFKGSTGVKINPQKVDNKDLSYCVLEGAEIKGSFDDTIIYYTNFKGTKGIKINPQKIRGKNLAGCVLTDTTLTGSFDGVNIRGTEFNGSKGAIIDIDKIYKKNIKYTDLTDALVYPNKRISSNYDCIDFDSQNVKTLTKSLKRR